MQHVASSQTKDGACVSCIGRRILYHFSPWRPCNDDIDLHNTPEVHIISIYTLQLRKLKFRKIK